VDTALCSYNFLNQASNRTEASPTLRDPLPFVCANFKRPALSLKPTCRSIDRPTSSLESVLFVPVTYMFNEVNAKLEHATITHKAYFLSDYCHMVSRVRTINLLIQFSYSLKYISFTNRNTDYIVSVR